MYNCDNCKNKAICKNVESSKEFLKEVEALREKYRELTGRLDVSCSFFCSGKRDENIWEI